MGGEGRPEVSANCLEMREMLDKGEKFGKMVVGSSQPRRWLIETGENNRSFARYILIVLRTLCELVKRIFVKFCFFFFNYRHRNEELYFSRYLF